MEFAGLTLIGFSILMREHWVEAMALNSSETLMDIAERLTELDPVRTYASRGAMLVAGLVGARSFRLDRPEAEPLSSEAGQTDIAPTISLPLRQGKASLGTLHLEITGQTPTGSQLQLLEWASRLFASGLAHSDRLAEEGSRRPSEAVEHTLRRAPLTPRERDVVSRLVSGFSTREIATETGLTVSTVNTYLKRIFSKLGVHSRVELIARMAGTATIPPRPS